MYKEALIVVLIILFIHTIVIAILIKKYYIKDHSAVEWNRDLRNEFVSYYHTELINTHEFSLKYGILSVIANSRFNPFKEKVSIPMVSKQSDLLWFVNFHELSHSIQYLKKEHLYSRFLKWANYVVVFVFVLFLSIIMSTQFREQLSFGLRIFLMLFMFFNTICFFYYRIFIVYQIEKDANKKTIDYIDRKFPEKYAHFLKYARLNEINTLMVSIYEFFGFSLASLIWIF